LGGIAVDIEEGNFGTCTDENGYYELVGLPLGTYNVAAGREFCDSHPFSEQIQPGVQTGSTNVDFFLEAVQNEPVLHVVPVHPEIHGHGWDPEAIVTIYVDDDDDLGNGILYTESKPVNDPTNWCGEPCFDVSGVSALPNGILPGHVVTMTDGEFTHMVHTTDLVWDGVDVDADTVFGTATPGSWVEVTSHGPEFAIRAVQVDTFGNWIVDFSVPGVEDFEQDVLDLGSGFHGRSIQFEGGIPDDGTLAYWHIEEPPMPFLNVQPALMWADSGNWAPGTSVTISFGSYLDTQSADGSGNVWFDLTGSGINPGIDVNITDGSDSKDLYVVAASFDGADDVENTAWGTAPPDMALGIAVVDINGYEDGFYWVDGIQADEFGNWFVDFDDYSLDFGSVMDAWVHVFDEDGDSTLAHLPLP
ncbi:MAG: hypothetical protein R3330_11680, partial [Saprospiraceae bacterium]|nr:hypothetical protein [Saprospiraceae bacterium]